VTRRFAVMVHVGPGRQELPRLVDLLDSLFHFEPSIPWLILVDDRNSHGPIPLARVPASCTVLRIRNPKQSSRFPHEGGLCVGSMAGFAAILRQTDADFVVKVDTDSLIIAPFCSSIGGHFDTHSEVGMAGSLGVSCDPASHLYRFTKAARTSLVLMHRVVERLQQQYPEPPTQPISIQTGFANIHLEPEQTRAAYRMSGILAKIAHWPSVGEFLHGGGYALSRRALEAIEAHGFLAEPLLWRDMRLGEDLLTSVCMQAAGCELANLSGEGEPFAVQQFGLPYPPEQLIRRGHSIVHSIKNSPHLSEADLRTWFGNRRRGSQPRQATRPALSAGAMAESRPQRGSPGQERFSLAARAQST
jgi:hypothetical protein